MSSNPAIASRLQSWPLVGRAVELGSLNDERNEPIGAAAGKKFSETRPDRPVI